MLPQLRKALPYLAVGMVAIAAYDGWFLYSRWHDARETERTWESKKADEARRTVGMLGGDRLKILNFYASPSAIRRGEHANICYGVNGAKSVRIEPPVEELHPALSHCLQVSPSTSTEYKLIAEDSKGQTATLGFVLQVAP